MRLDKFLKVSRLIKRRSVAKELCDKGRVCVNGRAAKAGTEITEGDQLNISLGKKVLEVEVKKTATTVKAEEAGELYTILSEKGK